MRRLNLDSSEATHLPERAQRTFTDLARLSSVAVPGTRDAATGGFPANCVRSSRENNYLLNGISNNVNVIDFLDEILYVR